MKTWSRYGPTGWGRKAVDAVADLIWPPVSPLSDQPVSAPGLIDARAWAQIDFLDAPWCSACGFPFQYDAGEVVCAACAARPPSLETVRSVFAYGDDSRQLILDFKHGGRTDALKQFGRWMARSGADALDGADIIIPVPLHHRRLFTRRYNQSALLGQTLARETGIGFDAGILKRSKATPTQGGRSARGRKRNVAGAFQVRRTAKPFIAAKRLVLVDDVMTTGATLEACARTLLRAGAKKVNAVTLSRVVRPVDTLT